MWNSFEVPVNFGGDEWLLEASSLKGGEKNYYVSQINLFKLITCNSVTHSSLLNSLTGVEQV